METLISICKNNDFEGLKSFLKKKENFQLLLTIDIFKILGDDKYNRKYVKKLFKFFKFIYSKNVEKEIYEKENKNLNEKLRKECFSYSYDLIDDFFNLKDFDSVIHYFLYYFDLINHNVFNKNNYTVSYDYFYEDFVVNWLKNPSVLERRILELAINKFYKLVNSIVHIYNNLECEEKDIDEDSEIALKIFDQARPYGDYDFDHFSDKVKKGICLYKLSTEKDTEKNYNFLFTYKTFKERNENPYNFQIE